METEKASRRKLLIAMLIWGSIGVFCRHVSLSSSVIALARAALGFLSLRVYRLLRKEKTDWTAVRQNIRALLPAALFLGFNWILLFEAYRYTTVAVATLCYYMAPVLVILCSPLLGEKLTGRKLLCAAVAVLGMVLVSLSGEESVGGGKGILLGLAAALLYASIILCNKRLKNISGMDRTEFQLLVAALVMAVYTCCTEDVTALRPTLTETALLLVLGVVHTGVAYALYFGSMDALPGQTVALYSYLDPVSAIFFSALLLREPLTLRSALGAALVLGATLLSEREEKN